MHAMPRILIIDDDCDYLALAASTIQRAGYSVSTATNGEEGLQAYSAHRPDLVLLDVNLPDISGLQICRTIRTDGPCPNTPIILCTTRTGACRREEGLRSGADDYVVKPFDESELLSRIKRRLLK